jgi:hypothetical protein
LIGVSLGSLSAASARIFTRARGATAIDSPQLTDIIAPDLRELARRSVARAVINHLTTISVDGAEMLDARLIDISPYGFQARARGPILTRGDRIAVTLPLVGDVPGNVMWGLKGFFGSKFGAPIEPDAYSELLGFIRGHNLTPIQVPRGRGAA